MDPWSVTKLTAEPNGVDVSLLFFQKIFCSKDFLFGGGVLKGTTQMPRRQGVT